MLIIKEVGEGFLFRWKNWWLLWQSLTFRQSFKVPEVGVSVNQVAVYRFCLNSTIMDQNLPFRKQVYDKFSLWRREELSAFIAWTQQLLSCSNFAAMV